jgi:alpha-galactosidase
LFARGAKGDIVTRTATGDWTSIGTPEGLSVYGRPSAVTDAAGQIHVAVRTNDDQVWERVRETSGVWGEWSALGGTISGSPTLVAAGDTVHLYARAGDYTLWTRAYTSDGWGGWSKDTAFASGAFDGSLGATADPDGSVLAAFRGVGGRLWVSGL